MSEALFQVAKLLECRHDAYGGSWPSSMSFFVAPDCAPSFPTHAWRLRWQVGTLLAATCSDLSRVCKPLCLWARGVDEKFRLSSLVSDLDPTESPIDPQVAVVVVNEDRTGSLSIMPLRGLRVRAVQNGSGNVELWSCDGQRWERALDATGQLDLSELGPGPYRVGQDGTWFYASDQALLHRPPVVIVIAPRVIASSFAPDGVPASLHLSGPTLFWRYFLFSEHWPAPATWELRSEAWAVTFSKLADAVDGDPFRIVSEDGATWVQFFNGARALGFVSTEAVRYQAEAGLRLVQAGPHGAVALPSPRLALSTLSRTTHGARRALCVDTFVHL